MSINAADIMRQLPETAEAIKNGKLDAESGLAVAAIADKQIGVMNTVLKYMHIAADPTLTTNAGDVFVGTESVKLISNGSK